MCNNDKLAILFKMKFKHFFENHLLVLSEKDKTHSGYLWANKFGYNLNLRFFDFVFVLCYCMYNWFSVDLASELRPSDCIDFKFLLLSP